MRRLPALSCAFGTFLIEALRCFKQELNFDGFEWKDDAATFSSAQRFAVSICQSSFGVAKPIRADRSGFPVFQDWAKLAIDSSGYVFLKIEHQSLE